MATPPVALPLEPPTVPEFFWLLGLVPGGPTYFEVLPRDVLSMVDAYRVWKDNRREYLCWNCDIRTLLVNCHGGWYCEPCIANDVANYGGSGAGLYAPFGNSSVI